MVKKIFVFIMILGLVFGSIPLFANNVKADEISTVNLASPDLTDKEYLFDGVYRLYDNNGITINYNVYNGNWFFNGTATTTIFIDLSLFNDIGLLTANMIVVFGSYSDILTSGWRFGDNSNVDGRIYFDGRDGYTKTYEKILDISNLRFSIVEGATFNNFIFKLQLEYGTTATPYQTPIQAIEQHEQNIIDNSLYIGAKYWNYWMSGTPPEGQAYTQIMSYDFGSGVQENFLWAMRNKNTWFGSKRWLISLDGQYEYFWASADNWESNNGSYYLDFLFDLLEIRTNSIIFYYNGVIVDEQSFDFLSSLFGLSGYETDFYLIRNVDNLEYINGYQAGSQVSEQIVEQAEQRGYNNGYDNGYDNGYNYGYNDGLTETDATGFSALLTTIFTGLGGLLAIELLPNIYIGSIIAVPLVFGIIFFILGKRKGE